MIKKLSFYLLGYFITLMMFSSCDYDYIHPEPIVLPTDSISFKTNIIPIFNKSCNISGCHDGTISPNLTAANAFQSLMSNDYINKQAPATSSFYLKITTGTMSDKGGITLTDKALILKWIEQGANNN
jgi:hypothetical protein